MTRSIEFNSVDLSDYGLVVMGASINRQPQTPNALQLHDRAVAGPSGRRPRIIPIRFMVTATTRAQLDTYLDAIKLAIVTEDEAELRRDTLSGRYWNAVLAEFDGDYISPIAFSGWMNFQCADPRAYDDTETSSDYNIDADPKTVTEAVGGTDYARPVYTLTAGENLVDVTIEVESLETGEVIEWTGSLANTEVLEIDTANFLVEKEGAASMATVSGEFPRLMPNQNNRIQVTGFSTTGTLNIKYRDTYL